MPLVVGVIITSLAWLAAIIFFRTSASIALLCPSPPRGPPWRAPRGARWPGGYWCWLDAVWPLSVGRSQWWTSLNVCLSVCPSWKLRVTFLSSTAWKSGGITSIPSVQAEARCRRLYCSFSFVRGSVTFWTVFSGFPPFISLISPPFLPSFFSFSRLNWPHKSSGAERHPVARHFWCIYSPWNVSPWWLYLDGVFLPKWSKVAAVLMSWIYDLITTRWIHSFTRRRRHTKR